MILANNLRKLRISLNLTQKEFSSKLGITQQTLSKYEKGTRNIPDEVKQELRQFGVNFNWFLTGDGEMFLFYNKEENKKNVEQSTISSSEVLRMKNPDCKKTQELAMLQAQINRLELGNTVNLPVFGEISCGEPLPIVSWSGQCTPVPQGLIKGDPTQYHVLIANGDSMKPYIHHEDYLLIKLNTDPEKAEGKVVAVMVNGEVTLKKFETHHDHGITILKPFNSDYPDLIFSKDSTDDIQLKGILTAQLRLYN